MEVFGASKSHESPQFMKVNSAILYIRINLVLLLSGFKCCLLGKMVWNVVLKKCCVACSVSSKHLFQPEIQQSIKSSTITRLMTMYPNDV